ncbi:Universal stress protein [compost metagenome]
MPCEAIVMVNDHPHEAIVETAQKLGCDLIIMGSHGRHGMTGFLLGSETQRVLARTRLPVLVYR